MRNCHWCNKPVEDGAWCDCPDGLQAHVRAEALMSVPRDPITPETYEGVLKLEQFIDNKPYCGFGFRDGRGVKWLDLDICIPVPCSESYWWILRFMFRSAWHGFVFLVRNTKAADAERRCA